MTVSADNPKKTRVITPARIVALVLIALVLGLAYLRFAPDGSVSVPAGAKAGDLSLESCTYSTEDGSYAATAARWSCPRIERIQGRD